MFRDAVLLIRTLFAHPARHRGAIGGMALFWAGDALAVWLALAAFGFLMDGAALVVGYCTGMVFTRRVAKITLAAPHAWKASGLGSGQVLGIPPCSWTTSSTVAATIRPPW